ncbi:hypothetical protein DPMN_127552 [Dreissena polymorpha]|uniref:Uncharacterized protein n=1 Tax=Dreissena polymorpha TaxID=45954 RepID=A0A9D4H263_DREPO|nr:hypothetical protein DPMN_127552 [Dreissena polymorpha]
MVLSPERLAADIARVRPFVCVCSLVDEQVVRFGEVTPAVLAHKLLLCPTIQEIRVNVLSISLSFAVNRTETVK